MIVLIFGLFILFLILAFYSLSKWNNINLPCFPLMEIIKYIIKNISTLDDIQTHLKKFHTLYGLTYQINIPFLPPTIVTKDPKYFEAILKSKEHLEKSGIYDTFEIVNQSIVVVNSGIWKGDRRVTNESMGHSSIKIFMTNLDKNVDKFIDEMMHQTDKPIDIQDVTKEFTLKMVVESVCDPKIEVDVERVDKFLQDFKELLHAAVFKMIFVAFKLKFLYNLTKWAEMYQKSAANIREFSENLEREHSKLIESGSETEGTKNLIYTMIKGGMPYERIIQNILVFVAGGHDTIASTICFTVFEIAKRPDIQLKILEETNEILGKNPDTPISMNETQKMKYLECVIKETLRLHTIFPNIFRKLHSDVRIGNHNDKDDVVIPKGSTIMFSIEAMHLSEEFYNEAHKYKPERFLTDSIIDGSFAPFSLGIRDCAGKKIAMEEVKLVLSKLIRKFQFHPVIPEHRFVTRAPFATRSINGIPVIFKLRKINVN